MVLGVTGFLQMSQAEDTVVVGDVLGRPCGPSLVADIPQFNHPQIEGHFHCFQSGAIINKTAVKIQT